MKLEWTIDKFSHWNREVHGAEISGPYELYSHIKLYPRGKDGSKGNVEVHIQNETLPQHREEAESVQLLYPIDGSMKTVTLIKQKDCWEGPCFDDIVAAIKKSEAPDELTVEWNNNFGITGRYVRDIHVSDTSVRLSADAFKSLPQRTWVPVFKLGYLLEDGTREYLTILAATSSCTFGVATVHLFVQSEFVRVFSLRAAVSFLRAGGASAGTLATDRVVRGKEVLEVGRLCIHETTQGSFQVRLKVAPGWCRHEGVEVMFPEEKAVQGRSFPSGLSEDLFCLHQYRESYDFLVRCGDVTFATHRAVLSSRSPVFEQLLSSDMIEAASGVVDIADLDPPTLARFVSFLYTGAVGDLQADSALKLYYAADKYLVPALKRECVRFLCANMSPSNVGDISALADKHQDDRLKSKVRDFMAESSTKGSKNSREDSNFGNRVSKPGGFKSDFDIDGKSCGSVASMGSKNSREDSNLRNRESKRVLKVVFDIDGKYRGSAASKGSENSREDSYFENRVSKPGGPTSDFDIDGKSRGSDASMGSIPDFKPLAIEYKSQGQVAENAKDQEDRKNYWIDLSSHELFFLYFLCFPFILYLTYLLYTNFD